MAKLKYENVANVGDTIRAFDFRPLPGRPVQFVEGVIESKSEQPGYRAFAIRVTNDCGQVVCLPDNRVGCVVYVPMQMSMVEYEGRIVKLAS